MNDDFYLNFLDSSEKAIESNAGARNFALNAEN